MSNGQVHAICSFVCGCLPCSSNPVSRGGGRLTSVSQSAVFVAGTNRLLAPVIAPRLTRASFVAQALLSRAAITTTTLADSPLKLTLEQGQGPYKTCVAASSASDEYEYSDLAAGVRIDDFDIRPEILEPWSVGLWLVLQRMAVNSTTMQREEKFQVLIMSEERAEVGAWGVGDG